MNRLGFWAALAACAASILYGIPQLLQVAGLLPDPLDRKAYLRHVQHRP